MELFIVGLRRGTPPPQDWISTLRRLPGVRILGTPSDRTARIEIETAAEGSVRSILGPSFVLEPLLPHGRL